MLRQPPFLKAKYVGWCSFSERLVPFGILKWSFQDRSVRVTGLEVLEGLPCDLPSRKKTFFFCAASSSIKILPSRSPFTCFLQAALCLKNQERTSKFVCNFSPVIVCDIFSSAMDFADSISGFQIVASVGRLAPEDTFSLLALVRQIRNFRNSARFRTQVVHLFNLFLGSGIFDQSFWLLHSL